MTEARFVAVFGVCLIFTISGGRGQTSILDSFVVPLRIFRKAIKSSIDVDLMSSYNQNHLKSRNKIQPIFSGSFPCGLYNTRSKSRPQSVHKLRPGDIDVIGALGDSLTAGMGIFSSSIYQLPFESRGASFICGGDASWKMYLTLANIFKVFNPNLYGYSSGNTFTVDPLSRFNIAEVGAISDNLPYMVKVLVKRIRRDPLVNVDQDWKFINILIGSNDFCSEMCYQKSHDKFLLKHQNDLLYVLRYLRDNLPRTLVNVIPPFNPMVLKQLKTKPNICAILHKTFCPCIFGVVTANKLDSYANTILRWQEMDVIIGNMDEFQTDDFTVVVQPLTINMTTPFQNGDLSYMSVDCFHFSQKGGAAAANNIWNSIITPVGKKSNIFNYKILDEFACPSEENPYIFTNKNSNL